MSRAAVSYCAGSAAAVEQFGIAAAADMPGRQDVYAFGRQLRAEAEREARDAVLRAIAERPTAARLQ